MLDLHSSDDALQSLTVSIYTIGYCLGPLIVAPVSELYGRVAVLYPAYAIFLVALAVCGSSTSLSLFIVFRAIMGFAGIAFVILGPAVAADLIPKERRGFALSILSAGPVVVSVIFLVKRHSIQITQRSLLTSCRVQRWVSTLNVSFIEWLSHQLCRSCNGRLHSGER